MPVGRQIEGKDYDPPARERISAWQEEQDFLISPNADDADACNVYKELTFPDEVYEHRRISRAEGRE